MLKNTMCLKYNSPAPLNGELSTIGCINGSWERWSLPLGNGYFGANIFGRTVTERIQISEPTLANPWYSAKNLALREASSFGGMNSFAEIFVEIGHENHTNYERSLCLEDATAYVTYEHNNVVYNREAFTSYPDKILAIKFSANKKSSISLNVKPIIPFISDYLVEEGDGFTKDGTLTVKDNDFIFEGTMGYYGIKYFGILRVVNIGGQIIFDKSSIKVENADKVILYFTCDTNYKLCPEVFLETENNKKLLGREVNKEKVYKILQNAQKFEFEELKRRHVEDYRKLYSRVTLNLNNEISEEYTDKLVDLYKNGEKSSYLETLLFQYGRYLLIASSRTRLPAHLQGIWNAYASSPWSCGYWHNINVQMNYWPSGPANISETFIAYINYAKAYMKKAKQSADSYIKSKYPNNYDGEGNNGWIIGTGGWPYHIDGFWGGSHSGPGTGAFTSLLFWDYFDYTRDFEFLREFGYPALYGMSQFFEKSLINVNGKYLVEKSASPENMHEGKHYHTIGCAFDQQMVYENFKRTIEAAELLNLSDNFIKKIKTMLPYLDPVLIGDDGQVKEYREETTYSSIGDPNHRHISQLVGLYPGTVINSNTKEWLEGAKVTLTRRGDKSTGWATAHRMLLWSRTKTPHKCRDLINSFISNNILSNLWDTHPPFQIDGNFGYTASICEMLLQSHSGYIELLPSAPNDWNSGSFTGLVARGNFVVDCSWQQGKINFVKVTSRAGGNLKIKLPENLISSNHPTEDGIYTLNMTIGQTITFS